MRNRRTALVLVAVGLLTLGVARHPSADIRILTHDIGDPAPHQMRAALDIGIAAVSVLVTWTGENLSG